MSTIDKISYILCTIDQAIFKIHRNARLKGFWEAKHGRLQTPDTPVPLEHASGSFTACCMLVVTELAEAVEAHRKGDDANQREEIADAVIRLFDLCGGYGINLADEIEKKMAVNEKRPYKHGKEY